MGKGRKAETVKQFFALLSEDEKSSIEAVAMDIWDSYIKAVKGCCPGALIVFDQFHLVSAFNRVIDRVCNRKYRKVQGEGKEVLKGSKYILLKNRENLQKEEKQRLREILRVNESISTVYILKDYLKRLWRYRYSRRAKKILEFWCLLARESGLRPVIAFAKTVKRYAYGIINHCLYPLHTSSLEGINNKIKVIKRKAYGFHDVEYFSLVIKNAFTETN